jgi:hypothetical protein
MSALEDAPDLSARRATWGNWRKTRQSRIEAKLDKRVESSYVRQMKRILLLLVLVLGAIAAAPVQSYKVVHTYPHDPGAFTQGLVFYEGFLYEGTGELGHSRIRKVELESGKVLQERSLPPDFFGEGIAILGGKLYEITWQTLRLSIYCNVSPTTPKAGA